MAIKQEDEDNQDEAERFYRNLRSIADPPIKPDSIGRRGVTPTQIQRIISQRRGPLVKGGTFLVTDHGIFDITNKRPR